MPLLIVRNDITKMQVDAIVNAANPDLLGGGGVDGAIHRAAGEGLRRECGTLGGCNTGEAKVTGAYDLPAKYVIHTVGPVWYGGERDEESLLGCCYRNSLALAKELGCETVAFPLISAGAYGYPVRETMSVAKSVIGEFLESFDMTVYMVIFDQTSFAVGNELFSDIQSYIDDRYAGLHAVPRRTDADRCMMSAPMSAEMADTGSVEKETTSEDEAVKAVRKRKPFPPPLARRAQERVQPCTVEGPVTLRDALAGIDESFSEMLLRKIDESGMTDAQCYRKANIDRKLFSKIRGDKLYKPSKPTVIAFAIALELSIDETREMLMKAGFALSRSNKFDIIIEYFIEHENYNIFEINEALFAFDQSLLGA